MNWILHLGIPGTRPFTSWGQDSGKAGTACSERKKRSASPGSSVARVDAIELAQQARPDQRAS